MQESLEDVMPWQKLTRTYRHIGRLNRVMAILFRHGFGFAFAKMGHLVPRRLRTAVETAAHDENWLVDNLPEQLRLTFSDLGPTYVKLGQILAGRSDLLPPAYTSEFAKLQDKVPPFEFEKVKRIIREDLGGEISNFFSEFDEKPLAAASIAQGHRARLLTGEEVFVKVRRPDIDRDVLADLEIAAFLAEFLEKSRPELTFLHLPNIVAEFARNMKSELDLSIEASNMTVFAQQFKGRQGLKVPKVWTNLCSRRLITMEFIRGIKGSNLEGLQAEGIDTQKVASLGAELLLEQFFEHGMFHADLHPGNVFILKDGAICYIDFGSVGRITRREREIFAELLSSIVQNDEHLTTAHLLKLCTYDEEPDLEALELDISSFIARHISESLEDLDIPAAVAEIYAVCRRHRVNMRPHIYLMLKTLALSDAMGRLLDPQFSVLPHLKPFVARTLLKHRSPEQLLQKLFSEGRNYQELLEGLPADYSRLYRTLADGKMHFNLHSDDAARTHRLLLLGITCTSLALVQIGLLISAALLATSDLAPDFFGGPLTALLVFLMSATLFAFMCWLLIKHR